MIVNSKIALAFAAGALLASGIVYVALKPSARPAQVTVAAASSPATPDPPPAAPDAAAAPAPVADTASPEAAPAKTVPGAPRVTAPKYGATPSRPVQVATAKPAPDPVPPSSAPDPAPEVIEPPSPAPAPAPAPVAAPAPETAPEPAPAPAPDPVAAAPAAPPPPPPNRVTLEPGTVINVRLSEALSSDKNVKGDTFFATLDQPLVAGGFAIAERGARAEGHVVNAVPGGRGGATADLTVSLTKIDTSDGQQVAIETTGFDKKGESSGGENAAKVGGGAVLGAIIGAAVGGGRGAGIGAAAGGAAGAGGVLLTHGRAATLPTETRLTFRLQQAVTITEQPH